MLGRVYQQLYFKQQSYKHLHMHAHAKLITQLSNQACFIVGQTSSIIMM